MGSNRRRMSGQVLLRMDDGTRKALEGLAGGKALTSYLRDLIGQHLIDVVDMDPRTPEERQTYEAPMPWLPPEDTKELSGLAAAVSRLNGAVVQMTKAVRESGADALHADCEAVLSDLRAMRRELGDEVEHLHRKLRGK